MRRVIVTTLATLALLAPAASAQALHPLDVNGAKSRLGGCVRNHHNHATTCLIGWHKFERSIYFRRRPHWRTHTYWAMRVSLQRCDRTHCWGPAKEGTLRPRRMEGKPVASRTADAATASMSGDFCLTGTTVCAAPWNWFGGFVSQEVNTINRVFVGGCIKGALLGYGGAASVNLASRMLLETGQIAETTASRMAVGPEGAAVLTLAGCGVGMARGGATVVGGLFGGKK